MMTSMDSLPDLCLLTDSWRSGAILLCGCLSDLALARLVTVKATTETSNKRPDSQISLRWGNVLFISAGQNLSKSKQPKRNWRTPECKANAAEHEARETLGFAGELRGKRPVRSLLARGAVSGQPGR